MPRCWRLPSSIVAMVSLLLTVGTAACSSEAVQSRADPTSFGEVLALSLFEGGSVADRVVIDSVRRCMAEQGFEIPEVDETANDPIGLSDLTYVETYGYGISTDPPQTIAPVTDPLQQAVGELKPDEVDAFHRALVGSDDPSAQPSPASCLGLAFGEVEQVQQLLTDEVTSLAVDYAERVDADPRMVEAQAAWQGCLAAQGFGSYRDRLEIVEEISDRTTQSDADLPGIQAFERQIARIDFDCSQEEFETRRQVEAELSAAFAEDLAVLLLSATDNDD